jgi:hypothetical protein
MQGNVSTYILTLPADVPESTYLVRAAPQSAVRQLHTAVRFSVVCVNGASNVAIH